MATKTQAQFQSDASPIPAVAFLKRTGHQELPGVIASFGEDDFLRRRSLLHACELGGLDEATLRTFEGDECEWRDVHDELATRSLFDSEGRRAVRVRAASGFVTRYRDTLERWVVQPAAGSTLLLDVPSMPATTNLYKLIKKHGWLISAKLDGAAVLEWVLHWGKNEYGLVLTRPQGELLVERIGAVCGMLDCELAKLACFAEDNGHIDSLRVDELVGGWRTQTVWKLADWVAEGKVEPALEAIDRLLLAGQSTIGIAAQLSWSLRRYGVAAHLVEQMERMGGRANLPQALERAGFRPNELGSAQSRLIRIGRARAKELVSWLLELDLQLKGSHSSEARSRLALELFLLRLSDLKPSPKTSSP